ncbi:deoxynucleotide monophosphate kinase family protein [Kitasatospora sp. NPDC001664]
MNGVALIGRARSGKDTVAAILRRDYGFTRVALADPLKDMALAVDPVIGLELLGMNAPAPLHLRTAVERYGWERVKDEYPEARRFLQRLGSEGIREHVDRDFWIRRCLRTAAAAPGPVVVTDVRFANEAVHLVRNGFKVWFIDRGGPDGEHPSERLEAKHADLTIDNRTTLAALECQIHTAMKENRA